MQLIIFEDKKAYLDSSPTIDCNHPTINKKSLSLTKSCQTEIEKVKCLFEFVRDEISHSFDIQNSEVTYVASDVLEKGHGICFSKSHLLAAMVRSVGIPAGFCYQKLIFDEKSDKPYFILHGLNAIYLNIYKRWIRLDARGNKPGVLAEFSLETEQLAFPVREALGEKDYPYVFSKPDASVIECLSNSHCWNWDTRHRQLPTDLSERERKLQFLHEKYHYKTELIQLCRQHKLLSHGTKAELIKRYEVVL